MIRIIPCAVIVQLSIQLLALFFHKFIHNVYVYTLFIHCELDKIEAISWTETSIFWLMYSFSEIEPRVMMQTSKFWHISAIYPYNLRAQFMIQLSCISLDIWMTSSISFPNLTIRQTLIGFKVDYFLQCNQLVGCRCACN